MSEFTIVAPNAPNQFLCHAEYQDVKEQATWILIKTRKENEQKGPKRRGGRLLVATILLHKRVLSIREEQNSREKKLKNKGDDVTNNSLIIDIMQMQKIWENIGPHSSNNYKYICTELGAFVSSGSPCPAHRPTLEQARVYCRATI